MKVAYYRGANILATVSAAPFAYAWNDVAPGTYGVSAVVTDSLGATVTTEAVTVLVNAPGAHVFYIHSDQLNTPRVVSDENRKMVWQWSGDRFGADMANTLPGGNGAAFVFNLRFPGQYYDAETGLHYNYFRDYDPQTGRYIQSDPIGLGGGINTYGYVFGNPLSYNDPTGLQVPILVPPPPIPGVPNPAADANLAIAKALAKGMRGDEDTKSYETYTRFNPRTGQCYSGRTSGTGTPEENVKRRNAAQLLLNKEGFLPGIVDRSSPNEGAIRGREQMIIERNGGAQSSGGTSRNKINGISEWNFAKSGYMAASVAEFGSINRGGPGNACVCK